MWLQLENISSFFLELFEYLTSEKSPLGQGEVHKGSRIGASGVQEKCVRGQREVCQGLRRSACGVKEKCLSYIPHIQRKHISITPNTLFLDP